jgi:hypothetical protein
MFHEAYVRLVDQANPQDWDNSRHFLSAASEAMRRILIERARQRASLKRGGDRKRADVDLAEPAMQLRQDLEYLATIKGQAREIETRLAEIEVKEQELLQEASQNSNNVVAHLLLASALKSLAVEESDPEAALAHAIRLCAEAHVAKTMPAGRPVATAACIESHTVLANLYAFGVTGQNLGETDRS